MILKFSLSLFLDWNEDANRSAIKYGRRRGDNWSGLDGVIDEKGNETAMIKRIKLVVTESEDKVAHWCSVINNAKRPGKSR